MIPGLLSVILPNYNHAGVVGGQIAAVLGQSFRDFELIVLDDASTDHSVAVIESALGGDPRAKLIRNEKNLGVVMNVEKGKALARGEFLYFPAADDCILPGFFEKSISALQQVPEAGISFTVMAWLDGQTMRARPMPLALTPQATYLDPDAFCQVICGEHITGHTSIFRADAYQEALPPLDEILKLRWHFDWFVGSVVACRRGVCHIPEPLVAIRVEPESFSVKGMYRWESQREVIAHVLRLLKSEAYRDVLPYFAQGALLSGLPHVARTFLAHPELWDVQTLMLVQKPLLDWNLERRQQQQNHWNQGHPPA